MIDKFIKNKKIIALILLFLMIFSIVEPVLAISGNGKFVGGQYASKYRTTDNNDSDGILIRRLTNQTTGKSYTVFCTEHGTEFITGTVYNGQYYTPTNEQMKKAAQVAYYGWYKDEGDYLVDGGILDDAWAIPTRKKYVFTQQYLWEVLDQSHATFLDSGLQSEYVAFKANIENEINNMKKRPSFDGTEIEIKAGKTKIVTDSNNVLQNYNTINQTKDGIKFEHNSGENTLKITVPEDCKLESLNISDDTFEEWGMIKSGSEDHDTTMYFTFDTNIQNQLYSLNYNDPVSLSLRIKINLFGSLELSKLDEKGSLIDGATFNITGPDNFNRDVKVSGGKITLENLKPRSLCNN